MTEALDFHKVEGLGNDFLVIDWRDQDAPTLAAELRRLQAFAPQICNRRRGVGADGLLVITPADDPNCEVAMIVINHDGSRPEMCGNGLRCVALFLDVIAGLGTEITIETGAGPLRCVCVDESDTEGDVTIAMGPALEHGQIRPQTAPGRVFQVFSTGNPHAITFVNSDEDPEALARTLGPAIEVDPLFPDRTNVEFARIEEDGSITLWVWERGCGITEACGTGACATAAAAVRGGLAAAATALRVRLPGGLLEIKVPSDANESIIMTGPARLVFRGQLRLPSPDPGPF